MAHKASLAEPSPFAVSVPATLHATVPLFFSECAGCLFPWKAAHVATGMQERALLSTGEVRSGSSIES